MSHEGFTATSTLSVTPADAVDHLTISPRTAVIAPGGSKTYTVTAFDAFGNSQGDVTASARLRVVGGSCSDATCTATRKGIHTVTAAYGGRTVTATLRVS